MGWIRNVTLREDGVWRRKHAQAMRTASCRVEGSRWNRPCAWERFCTVQADCVCNRGTIKRLRSRCCNRVACSFLKFCRALPSYAEEGPPWRAKWGNPLLAVHQRVLRRRYTPM